VIDSVFDVMVLVLILKTSSSHLFCNVFNHFWPSFLNGLGYWCCYLCLPERFFIIVLVFTVTWGQTMV